MIDEAVMKKSELDYVLPPELIARHPADRRDASRLLVLDRATGRCRHDMFVRLPQLLPPRSLLVLNNTKVVPARLAMHRASGGRTEGLFLREARPGIWEVMLTGSGRVHPGEELRIDQSDRRLRLIERIDATTWHAQPVPGGDTFAILADCGHPPLPPYIRHARGQHPSEADVEDQESRDRERYQTVFAEVPGAVAAPTAGLHFAFVTFEALRKAEIEHVYVTLHVGAGTFLPIRDDDLADHDMHAEWYDLPASSADAINAAREAGRPIVAVGTTSVRVLETCGDDAGNVRPGRGETRLFIYPPYRCRVVDHLLTNFHLPGSTLLAMLFAMAGRETILSAYNQAIARNYRFYSYGDAMLVL